MQKSKSQDRAQSLEIGTLYEQELQSLHEKLRRQAARSLFSKLQLSNKITVEQLFLELKQHKEMWTEVASMGVVDFAYAVMGDRKVHVSDEKSNGKRTRLSDEQKESLKGIILHILDAHQEGLNRNQIATFFTAEQTQTLHISKAELSNKLRQPLSELLSQRRIHSQGTKRLLKYFAGGSSQTGRGKKS